jgi:hypothetical protein
MNKEDNMVDKLNKFFLILLVLVLSMGVGELIRSQAVKDASVPIQQIKSDALPLENGGEIIIKSDSIGNKVIIISLEDLTHISKSKSKVKKLVENVTGLFARMED